MRFRASIVFALAVALAFAGFAGPRHARAAVQGHDHPATAGTAHSHAQHQSGAGHSHDHGAAMASQFGEGGKHDHAGTPPTSDQGCCYAWCNSVAIIHATDGLAIVTSHDEHFTSEQPFRIAAISSAIDPPPR